MLRAIWGVVADAMTEALVRLLRPQPPGVPLSARWTFDEPPDMLGESVSDGMRWVLVLPAHLVGLAPRRPVVMVSPQ